MTSLALHLKHSRRKKPLTISLAQFDNPLFTSINLLTRKPPRRGTPTDQMEKEPDVWRCSRQQQDLCLATKRE